MRSAKAGQNAGEHADPDAASVEKKEVKTNIKIQISGIPKAAKPRPAAAAADVPVVWHFMVREICRYGEG